MVLSKPTKIGQKFAEAKQHNPNAFIKNNSSNSTFFSLQRSILLSVLTGEFPGPATLVKRVSSGTVVFWGYL